MNELSLLTMSAAGSAAQKLYSNDVFSTYLYTGNGSTQTINNGIDLAGKGGLVWTKARSDGGKWHEIVDSVRGVGNRLFTNSTSAASIGASVDLFLSNGFGLRSSGESNELGASEISWTFRKAPKFFDVVTYTGNGVAGRQIPHSLGVAPGMILVKCTSTARNWLVYQRSIGATKALFLDLTDPTFATPAYWNNTEPTASVFSVGTSLGSNTNGDSYVAYLFAHDPSADGIIQCGSYTGNGSATGPIVTLGWEPQYLMIKNTVGTGNWQIIDNMRGMPVGSADATLQTNMASAEASADYISPTATGFQVTSTSSEVNTSGSNYIYLAIRRPNKPPTTGTQVYNAIARTGTGAAATVTGVGFAPDLVLPRNRSASSNTFFDNLRGAQRRIRSNETTAEAIEAANVGVLSFLNDGVVLGSTDSNFNASGQSYINHFFRRTPGVFDVVCYTGTGVARTVPHSLGVAPELILFKRRDAAGMWPAFTASIGVTAAHVLHLNNTNIPASGSTYFNSTLPTASVFSLGTNADVNASTATYVSYLFATKAGILKVGSYTGNGASQTINCGFTAGARFVMVKATSTTGDWLVADTTRGIISANDPRLSLNTTAAEVTTEDWLDPDSSGFVVNQVAGSSANASGVSYIFLAIA